MTSRYVYCLCVTQASSLLEFTEILDIGVVCASYDVDIAIYLSGEQLSLFSDSQVDVQTQFNMLNEFEVPLMSDATHMFCGYNVVATAMDALIADSKHVLVF